MKFIARLILVFFMLSNISYTGLAESNSGRSYSIRLDQIGYQTNEGKIATIVLNGNERPVDCSVVDARDGRTVLNAKISNRPVLNKDSNENVCEVDFSAVNRPGRYFLEADGIASSELFEVADKPYAQLFRNAVRAFYFQRCGMALKKIYAHEFARNACHKDDAEILQTGKHRNSKGGWHDAADYGKKVVPGAVSAGILLMLYDSFPKEVGKVSLGIPRRSDLPDYLSEVKYELDWMLTMQNKDGSVSHLITTKEFPQLGTMPGNDSSTRYIVGYSSAATADFAAVMAMAARIFRDYNPGFSRKARKASENAWGFLSSHQDVFPPGGYKDPEGFKGTGNYGDKDDRDERFWAAVELYRTTKDDVYHKYILEHYSSWGPTVCYPPSWLDVHTIGMFNYVNDPYIKKDPRIKNAIVSDLNNYANSLVERIRTNPYGTALSSTDYYWGSNGVALGYSMILLMANKLSPSKEYVEGAYDQMHYILGRNPLNMSYVTGMGTNYPRNPLHNPSIAIGRPIPGFLVGGPNNGAEDSIISYFKSTNNLPPAKCYVDNKYSYSTNEVCLYWNAMLAFVSGYLNFLN